MKRAAAFLVLSLAAAPAFAAFSKASRGTSAAAFLSLGGGARGAGMGGAQAAAAEGASSVIWNPAAPASAPAFELEAMHGDWFEDADYNFAAAVAPFGSGRALSVSYQNFGVGDLDRRDVYGFNEGSFSPEDSAAALGFASAAGDYQLGASVKMIRSKIVSSASTFALDLARAPESNGRRFGAAITNLGGKIKYDSAKEDLPLTVAIGAVQKFGRHVLAADVKLPRDNSPYVALGAEASLVLGGGLEGKGRVGYSTRAGSAAGSLAGASLGVGVSARWFSIDYAFAPFGDLGSVHIFSLAVRGGGKQPE